MTAKKKWWIVAIVLLGLTGLGFALWRARRTAADKPDGFNIPPGGTGVLDANAVLADPYSNTSNVTPPAPAALVKEQDADTQAAIAIEARRIERNTQLRNIVAKREQIGGQLFESIPQESRDLIAASFGKAFDEVDPLNELTFPIYGRYNTSTRAVLREQIDAILKANPSGFMFASKYDKMGALDPSAARRGIVPAWANYNFLTGKNGAATFSTEETEYFLRVNGIANTTMRGVVMMKFLQNFIAEIDRLNAALYEQAVANLLHRGWRIAGRSAPTKDEVT